MVKKSARKAPKKAPKKHHNKSTRRMSEDDKQRRKYNRGGRVEAYTFGEALSSKRWP